MVGHARPKWGTASPRTLAAVASGLYVSVEDVDAHCRRARAAGAAIESEPADQDWGDRMYGYLDERRWPALN